MKIEVKNLAGKVVEKIDASTDVFGMEINEDILSQVYVAQHANKRHANAHTKTRGEVRGSTRKPWKQKGTGRARTGSVKNPIWRSGGIVFGPRNNRNYSQKINKQVARLAIKMALSGTVKDNSLVVLENYDIKENKTKVMAKAINDLGLKGGILFVNGADEKDVVLATRNIKALRNISIEKLNVFDILNSRHLIISKQGIKFLEKKYAK